MELLYGDLMWSGQPATAVTHTGKMMGLLKPIFPVGILQHQTASCQRSSAEIDKSFLWVHIIIIAMGDLFYLIFLEIIALII